MTLHTRLRYFLQLACALGLASILGATLVEAQPAAVPAHLERGLLLVDQIVAQQSAGLWTDPDGTFLNRYGGSWNHATDPSFIRFLDPATGVRAANNTTCTPFITHLLKKVYGWNWSLFPIPDPLNNNVPSSGASPKAYRYVAAIKSSVGFAQQLATLSAVQPGDIAAYWDVGTDNGHGMIVVHVNAASAIVYPAGVANANPALAGTTYYEVTILDSTSSGHSRDTRLITYNGETYESGGAGTGVMGVFVNAAGNVVGHTFSLPTASFMVFKKGAWVVNPTWITSINSRLKLQTNRELVFGRLPDLPALP